MKALIIVIASLLSAQAMAAPTIEVKPIEIGRAVELKPIELTPIRPTVRTTVTTPVVAAPVTASGIGAQAQCSGDMADQLVQGSGKLNAGEVREALRFWGTRLSVGRCQGTNKAAQGLLGYDVEAREHLLIAAIDTMNVLKRMGDYSAAQAKAAFDKELGEEGVAATVTTLEQCEIMNKTYFN